MQILYERPYKQRLSYADIKALADALVSPPRSWNYQAALGGSRAARRIHGARFRPEDTPGHRVRGALRHRQCGGAYPIRRWSAGAIPRLDGDAAGGSRRQAAAGRTFIPEQVRCLEAIRDHIAGSVSMEMGDFQYAPFNQQGGLGKAYELFGQELEELIEELNGALVA